MYKDNMILRGHVQLVLTDVWGNVKQEGEVTNLVTTLGKAFVASAIIAAPTLTFTYMAVGTSNTAPAVGQTALVGTELARVACTSTNPTSTTVRWASSYGAGVGTGTIEEAGMFSAAAAGTMFNRVLTGTYAKGALDTLAITWTLTVS